MVDGVVRALKMPVAQVQKPLVSVYDMCQGGHRIVFEIDPDGTDKSYAINLKSGEKPFSKLRNRVWELDMRVIPVGKTADLLRREREKLVDLPPFGGQVNRP